MHSHTHKPTAPQIIDERIITDEDNVVVTYHNPLDRVPDLAHIFFKASPCPPPHCSCCCPQLSLHLLLVEWASRQFCIVKLLPAAQLFALTEVPGEECHAICSHKEDCL